MTLDQPTATITVGGSVQLSATVEPDSVDQGVTWSSSDTNIVTVSGGKVTAKQTAGEADVTATSKADPTKTAVSHITVTEA